VVDTYRQIKSSQQSQAGFTLVEMMVVVAIMGILLAVAVPNYQKFQSTMRFNEARLSLGQGFIALKAYRLETLTYTSCLKHIGFIPPEFGNGKTYYTVGFSAASSASATCGPYGGRSCLGYIWLRGLIPAGTSCAVGNGVTYFRGQRSNIALPSPTIATFTGTSATVLTNTAFTLVASGVVAATRYPGAITNNHDAWSINQDKMLTHIRTSP
jgi:prepilin-type N-terminal cleavage/methylation domain-containing protein